MNSSTFTKIKSFVSKFSQSQKLVVGLAVILFAGVGTYALLTSRAETPPPYTKGSLQVYVQTDNPPNSPGNFSFPLVGAKVTVTLAASGQTHAQPCTPTSQVIDSSGVANFTNCLKKTGSAEYKGEFKVEVTAPSGYTLVAGSGSNPRNVTVWGDSNSRTNFKYSKSQTPVEMRIPLYRLYSKKLTDHFYTTSKAQRDRAIRGSYQYQSEGIAGYVIAASAPGNTPLYRLYSKKLTDHFYTTSKAQRDRAIRGSYQYQSEGIAGYVIAASAPGNTPLYRLYSKKLTDHFYTTSKAQRDRAIRGSYQYQSEGIAGYVYTTQQALPPPTETD